MDEAEELELRKKLKWYENKYGPAITEPGMKNWKNLFRKPTMYEWVILAMLILALFMFWAYNHDTKAAFQNGYNTCIYNFSIAGKFGFGTDNTSLPFNSYSNEANYSAPT